MTVGPATQSTASQAYLRSVGDRGDSLTRGVWHVLALPLLFSLLPLGDDTSALLDPVAMRSKALALEARGRTEAALEAWERVVDRSVATDAQRLEAVAAIRRLRPEPPESPDPARGRPWRTLVLIYRHLDFSWPGPDGQTLLVRATVSAGEERRIRDGFAAFARHVLRFTSGALRIDADYVVVDEPLTRLSGEPGGPFWPAPWDVAPTTDRLMAGRQYDSVFVYVKCREGDGVGIPLLHGGGTFGADYGPHGAGWTDIPFYPEWLDASGEIELHEWLHQIDWMFTHVLCYPDAIVPSSDEGRREGEEGGDADYRRSADEPDWMGFYRHIMRDHITRLMWSECGMHDPRRTPWSDDWLHEWLAYGPVARPEGAESGAPSPAGSEWRPIPWPSVLLSVPEAPRPGEESVFYVATWIRSPAGRRATLELWTGCRVRAWVNGKLAAQLDSMTDADRGLVARLRPGWNPIIIECALGPDAASLRGRLVGPDGTPLRDVEQRSARPD